MPGNAASTALYAAPKIDFQCFLKILTGHYFQRPGLNNASIVNEDVEAAGMSFHRLHEVLHLHGIGHVTRQNQWPLAIACKVVPGPIQSIDIAWRKQQPGHRKPPVGGP